MEGDYENQHEGWDGCTREGAGFAMEQDFGF